jgi:hypothetical protein
MTTRVHAQIPRGVRVALIVLSLVGLVGAVLTFWLGFEEPNSSVLWVSVLALASAQMWGAFSEYLSSPDLAGSADRMAAESEPRTQSPASTNLEPRT